MQGTVKWFNATKGFGFIQPNDGTKDIFVHHSALRRAGITTLVENQPIQFEVEKTEKGLNAVNLRVA